MRFLTYDDLDEILMEFGTPTFVYDEATLRANAREVLNFPNAFGLFPRYAMKAAPTAAILRIFNEEGLGIDASSVHEVERAVRAGFGTEAISLSTQELADDFIYRGWHKDQSLFHKPDTQNRKMGESHTVGLRFNPAKDLGK